MSRGRAARTRDRPSRARPSARHPPRHEHRDAGDREVAREQQRDLARRGVEVLREHGQDRVHEPDAHEGDHAREGDRPDGLGLVGDAHSSSSISRSSSGSAAASAARSSAVKSLEAALEQRGARGAHRLQAREPVVGQMHAHGPRVVGVRRAPHQPVALEAPDERRDRRLRDRLGLGELGDPARAGVAQRRQHGGRGAAHLALAPPPERAPQARSGACRGLPRAHP